MKILITLLMSFSLYAALTEQDKSFISPKNLLSNPGAEMGKSKWTASGGTFTTNATAANIGSGVAAFDWDSSAASQNLTSSAVAIPAGAYNRNGVASCNIKCASGTCTHTINAYDGTNILASNTITSSSTYTRSSINFVFPASGNIQLRLSSVAANEPQAFVDDCYLGLAEGINLQNVSQAQLYGVVKITGCANPWSTTSTTFADFATQTSCSYAVEGNASAPSTNIPAIKFSNLPPGEYIVQYEGNVNKDSTGSFNSYYQFSDGTNTAREISVVYAGNTLSVSPGIFQSIKYTTAQSNVTLSLRAKTDSGGNARIWGTTSLPGVIKVYRFPVESDLAYRPDQVAWKVDAVIGGANPSLGTSSVSTATGISNGSLTLTQNASSISTQIACDSTNAPTGTTCSTGNEQVGVSWNQPVTGEVMACVFFSHLMSVVNGGFGVGTFRMVETATNSQTALQTGSTTMQSTSDNSGTTASNNHTHPIALCDVFRFSTPGQKVLRLFYTQEVGGSGLNSASILADQSTGTNNSRQIHWVITPLTQNMPAPLLVGSVTSNSSGLERTERANVAGSSTTTASCTTSPCTVNNQSGSWLSSVTRSSAGVYVGTIASGIFAAKPICLCSTSDSAINRFVQCDATSSTNLNVNVKNSANNADDSAFNIICMGPR